MKDLLLEDSNLYRRWLIMDVSSFEELLGLVKADISKQGTIMSFGIAPLQKFGPHTLQNPKQKEKLSARFSMDP